MSNDNDGATTTTISAPTLPSTAGPPSTRCRQRLSSFLLFIDTEPRELFEIVLTLGLLYNCIVVPFRFGFGPSVSLPLAIVDLFVDALFLADVIMRAAWSCQAAECRCRRGIFGGAGAICSKLEQIRDCGLLSEEMEAAVVGTDLDAGDEARVMRAMFRRYVAEDTERKRRERDAPPPHLPNVNVNVNADEGGQKVTTNRNTCCCCCFRGRRRRRKLNSTTTAAESCCCLGGFEPFWRCFVSLFRNGTVFGLLFLFPYEWVLQPWGIGVWGRVPRLFFVVNASTWLQSVEKVAGKIIAPVFFSLFVQFANLLLMIHLFSCVWFSIAKLPSYHNNFVVEIPVKVPLLYEALMEFPGSPWSASTRFRQYLTSFYFAATYVNGFNNAIPQDTIQSVYCCAYLLVGAFFFVIIVGNISTLLHNMGRAEQEFTAYMNVLEKYLNYKKVSPKLQRDVKDYFRCLKSSGHLYVAFKEELFPDLDVTVKKRISKSTKGRLVRKVKMFAELADEFFIQDICLHLEYLLVLEGYNIVQEGAIGREMFFLIAGSVDVIVGDKCVAQLGPGSYFGEIALLKDTPRMASIVAREVCEVYVLSQEYFKKILDRYKPYREIFEREARLRLEASQKK